MWIMKYILSTLISFQISLTIFFIINFSIYFLEGKVDLFVYYLFLIFWNLSFIFLNIFTIIDCYKSKNN
ncbi:hypothetical protein SFLOR_v1c01990 [Spiroplasma floricola 23-6]|uniref:Uncharacterized protein n=1 Tax=Spiroplasma floricola 23-6 TaxID=1336749 RepID=A0A2K8SEJ2_9MOLU|nr:hypothetical protein SFLOR_v1c01990 [Spiroplasma floricola 23-6]